MGLENFILTCEKDNEKLRYDLSYYKSYSKRLKEKNEKYKEVIDKAIKYIEQHAITVTDGTITTNKHELLEMLKEV